MIILDTDTISLAQHPDSPEASIFRSRIVMLPRNVSVAATIISYEEQMRGWLAFLARAKSTPAQISAYAKLLKHLQDWRAIHVLPFDQRASARLDQLLALKLRIGSYDLRIAAIALVHNATLITRNRRDFARIPNLLVEDWTRE